jgi:hypothetical protein
MMRVLLSAMVGLMISQVERGEIMPKTFAAGAAGQHVMFTPSYGVRSQPVVFGWSSGAAAYGRVQTVRFGW